MSLRYSTSGGKGIKCYKINEKTGNVIGVKAVKNEDEIMLITTEGIIIQMPVSDISVLGRITSGVKLIDIEKGSDITVASIAKVRNNPDEGKDEFDYDEEYFEEISDAEDNPEEEFPEQDINNE